MFKLILFLIILGFFHAKWEIEIEGSDGGWAKKLPCWRIDAWFNKLLGEGPLTGYHFFMIVTFLILVHIIYFFTPFTLKQECILLGLFIIYFIIEDFLWFALNYKVFGIKNFKKGRIWWHKKWIGSFPISYWLCGFVATILLLLGK